MKRHTIAFEPKKIEIYDELPLDMIPMKTDKNDTPNFIKEIINESKRRT